MTTTYTFHAAIDHSIVATLSNSELMAEFAETIAEGTDDGKTRRFYVHNGVGVVAAFLTRQGNPHQILRDDYMQFSDKAKAQRAAHGLND